MGNVTNRDAKGKTKGKNRKATNRSYGGKKMTRATDTAKSGEEIREQYEASKRGPGCNDISWYNAYPQLLKDAGTFSFNNPIGSALELEGSNICAKTTMFQPGVMAFNVAPTFGRAQTWNDAVNVAARRFYTFIRHANSGHANYDAPNLMMYLMAVDSVYSLIAHMNRIYGLLQMFSVRNRYYPAAILTAIGVDYDSFVDEMADFRYFINHYTAKAASLCVPSDFTFYRRHTQLFQGVYLDAPNDKAQTYVFKPAFVYKYTVGTEFGSNTLEPIALPAGMTLSQMKEVANSILDAILLQEDMNIMSGDILKAYGREGLYSLAMMPEGYTTTAAYNPEMLMQIHNATIMNVTSEDYLKWKVSEVTTAGPSEGCLWMQYPCTISALNVHTLFDKMIDVHIEDPSPEDIMLATRLSVICSNDPEVKNIVITSCGSEVIVEASYYVINPSNGNLESTTAASAIMALTQYAGWSRFHDAPILYKTTYNQAEKSVALNYIVGELDNYSVIKRSELKKLHETALTSLLTAPTMAGLSAK